MRVNVIEKGRETETEKERESDRTNGGLSDSKGGRNLNH